MAGAVLLAPERGLAAGAEPQADRHALLDVPYMPQTPALCGGAAVAMVLRYWGQRDVFPQDFAHLVGTSDGILTSALASAVRERGSQPFIVPAADNTARARIQSEIDRGRPLIALIEVGPRTYHYVVIVGATDQEVVMHDPARAPFRVMPWAEFDLAWASTERWMMLVLPPDAIRAGDTLTAARPPQPEAVVSIDRTPCRALVERAVDMALDSDPHRAEDALLAATRFCPDDPASWRELAGWRFSQSRWPEAQELAAIAVRLAPDDAYTWKLLATSRYLMGDMIGALTAWNRAGDPRVDAIVVHGAARTGQAVIVRAAALQPRQVLTPQLFQRAVRRLRDLPVASNARITFEPLDGGMANVDVFLSERDVAPRGWLPLSMLGARALIQDAVHVDVAGPLGSGELASVAWRWSPGRPRLALSLAVPSPHWLPGVVSVEGSWERQSYRASATSSLTRETRRRAGLRLADWSTGWLRWEVGAALDRLHEYDELDDPRFGARDYVAVEGTADVRFAEDRVALVTSAGWWTSVSGGIRFGTSGLQAAWRSTERSARPLWSATTSLQMASRVAPAALWPGAGTGQGRDGLLRAHPLLSDGVMTGQVFGREVARGSLEYARPVMQTPAGPISIAGFVDAARAWHRPHGLPGSSVFVDAGTGVRLQAPGSNSVIRIDIAHGLRGGGATLSAGWGAAWPRP